MRPTPDILIVGGGAIGSACARALALAGHPVTLVTEADEDGATAGAAWLASAGMLAAQVEGAPDDPLLPLALAGQRWFAALAADTRRDIGMLDCGIVELAHSDATAHELQARVSWQKQRGLNTEWLSASDVAARCPWLGANRGGFWSPNDGAVDPRRMVARFRADAVQSGARIITDRIVGLDVGDGVLRGVRGARARYAAGTIVIAAGAWSRQLQQLPAEPDVAPVRGQMIAFPWPHGASPAIVYGNGCYMLRRGDELIVGATVEQVGFDAHVTVEGIAELHARASSVYPALRAMTPLRSWAGLRPGTSNGRPIIGEDPRLRGLWYATGHGRNGILLAGITGELLASGIRGEAMREEFSRAVNVPGDD